MHTTYYRPVGMVERELSAEEVASVSAQICASVPLDVLASLPSLNSCTCLDFFDKAAERPMLKPRLEEFSWLLKPLCSIEPKLILNHSSLEAVLKQMLATLMPMLLVQADVLASALACDLRSMLSQCKKVKRNWKYQAKAQNRDWPQRAEEWPGMFEIVQLLDVAIDATPDKNATPDKTREPESQIEKKRARVLEELQGATIQILDDSPVEPAKKSLKADRVHYVANSCFSVDRCLQIVSGRVRRGSRSQTAGMD